MRTVTDAETEQTVTEEINSLLDLINELCSEVGYAVDELVGAIPVPACTDSVKEAQSHRGRLNALLERVRYARNNIQDARDQVVRLHRI